MLCFIWLPQFSCSLGQRVVSKHGNPRRHATGKEEEGSEIGLRLPPAPSLGALGTSLCVLNPSRGPPRAPLSRWARGMGRGCHCSGESVTKPRFMFRMNCEAEQPGRPEAGAEKGLLQGHARRTGGLCSKLPQRPSVKHSQGPGQGVGLGCVISFCTVL